MERVAQSVDKDKLARFAMTKTYLHFDTISLLNS